MRAGKSRRDGTPWARLAVNGAAHAGAALATAAILAALLRGGWCGASGPLLACAAAAMMLVVFGMRLKPTRPEGTAGWTLANAWLSRESIIPLGLPLGLLASGRERWDSILEAPLEQYPVVWLILLFALLAYGLDRTGFFRLLATATLNRCGGSVARLTIGFYMLNSALTYLTSNDVVILMMTPLALELARQSGIRDVRMILVAGCFIAANTMSAGLPMGSPPNVIVALSLDMGFREYAALMALPSLLTAASSLLVVAFVYSTRQSGIRKRSVSVPSSATAATHSWQPAVSSRLPSTKNSSLRASRQSPSHSQ